MKLFAPSGKLLFEGTVEEYKQKQQQEKTRAMEINNIMQTCSAFKLSESAINSIIVSGISLSEFESRLAAVEYYRIQYPRLNIDLSYYLTKPISELSEFVQRSTSQVKQCLGDCSSCRRDNCIMDA